jgi:hypothetical protein
MPQFPESCFIKWLCEYIGKLVIGANIREINISSVYMIPDEMMTNLNILHLVVLNRVVGNLDCTFIIT